MLTAEERYIRDPHFHGLVRQLYQLISGAQFTPTELREALVLALTQYEWEHPRSMCFSDVQRWAEQLEPSE